jgi:hypothetical protein
VEWSSKYGTLEGSIPNLITASSCEWLARDADGLLSDLKAIRQVLDKDLDRAETEASAHPLRRINSVIQDRSKWTETHVRVFTFQTLYTHHVSACNQLSGTFGSDFVTSHAVSERDVSTVEQVAEGLEDHRNKLKRHATILRSLA